MISNCNDRHVGRRAGLFFVAHHSPSQARAQSAGGNVLTISRAVEKRFEVCNWAVAYAA